jgi:hypothetical protein
MLEYAKKNEIDSPIEYILADLTQPLVLPLKFDLILMPGVLLYADSNQNLLTML